MSIPAAAPEPSRSPPAQDGRPPVLDAGIDARALARLRWRCRRGMLENDLILARFLDARAAALSAAEVAALDTLLDYSDNDLWSLLSGREEPADASLAALVGCLRSI
ncbi:MAG: succinate dehydrogenase assembly factor 2 [Steroidobacterales bacterium]